MKKLFKSLITLSLMASDDRLRGRPGGLLLPQRSLRPARSGGRPCGGRPGAGRRGAALSVGSAVVGSNPAARSLRASPEGAARD
jgi:hypothetical protein